MNHILIKSLKFKSNLKEKHQEKLQKEHQIKLGKIDKDNKVDSLIVAVGHNQFRALSAKELKSFCNGLKPVIGDVKSIYNKQELIKEGFSVFRL